MAERYAVWLDRDVVEVTGPEASSYLQGQLSQDVLSLPDGATAWSWVLSPQGKVDAFVRATRLAEDRWLLDTDGGWGDPVVARLNRFKLRTKVEVEYQPWRVLGLRGAGSEGVAFEWGHLQGRDVLGPDPQVPEGWPLLAPEHYEAERIVAGFPRMGAELTEKTIPAETGLIDKTVSFTKGCYTGQELVARIDSRGGHVPRHLRSLVLEGPAEPGTELLDAGGGAVGTLTSVAHSPARGWVGLGYLRRGFEVPGWVRAGPAGVRAEVRELSR